MKRHEIVTKQTTKLVEYRCDICNADLIELNLGFKVDQVTIECRVGTMYPEGGPGETLDVDMCAKCFREKLVPWLELQGATVREREWE